MLLLRKLTSLSCLGWMANVVLHLDIIERESVGEGRTSRLSCVLADFRQVLVIVGCSCSRGRGLAGGLFGRRRLPLPVRCISFVAF